MASRKQKVSPGNRDKRTATIKPVKDVGELNGFWDRSFELTDGYREAVVEVVERKNNVLTFFLLDPASGERRGTEPLSVNLDDGTQCWSALPSTAQDVDPESSQRSGYLFLAPAWIKRVIGPLKVFEGPGGGIKWPRSLSL